MCVRVWQGSLELSVYEGLWLTLLYGCLVEVWRYIRSRLVDSSLKEYP